MFYTALWEIHGPGVLHCGGGKGIVIFFYDKEEMSRRVNLIISSYKYPSQNVLYLALTRESIIYEQAYPLKA